MKRPGLFFLGALASLFVASCGSSPSSGPVTSPARAANPASGPYHIVLLEAEGTGPEVESFISRLSSDLSDIGTAALVDARLSGAKASDLSSDAGKALKKAWPADAYLAVTLPACSVKTSRSSYFDTTPEGYRVERQIVNMTSDCKADLKLVHDKAGRNGDPDERFSVSGHASFRMGDSEREVISSEEQAIFEAAKKAAKKLSDAVKH